MRRDRDGGRERAPHWYPDPDPEARTQRVAVAFEERFGRPPAGVWAAPGRVNLVGEHVDYTGGLCLPFALAHRTYAALAPRDDGVVGLRSLTSGGGDWTGALADVAPGSVDGWAGYAVGVPWALEQAGIAVPGFDAVIDGTVPLGSGLSSSAALECAVAIALDDVLGLGWGADDAGRARLAAACVRAENDIAGAPTGGMDQAASLRSRVGAALLLDCRDFSVAHVPCELGDAGLTLLVMDTRAHHTHVDGRYGSRRETCQQAARLLDVPDLRAVGSDELDAALARIAEELDDPGTAQGGGAHEMQRRVRHVVTEIERVGLVAGLLEARRLRDIGAILDASHRSLRDDYEVSSPELDEAVEAAGSAGALGARMTGGGFGGSAIALVEAGDAEKVAMAVAEAFDGAGFGAPAFLLAFPSAPATRVA
jgi:galactokinase